MREDKGVLRKFLSWEIIVAQFEEEIMMSVRTSFYLRVKNYPSKGRGGGRDNPYGKRRKAGLKREYKNYQTSCRGKNTKCAYFL